MLLILAFAIRLVSDFEGGNIHSFSQPAPNYIVVSLPGETDQDGRNRQASWFYVRFDSAGREELLIDLVGLPGEYNYTPNLGPIDDRTPPVISYDQQEWEAISTVEYDKSEPRLRLRIRPKRSRFWIARVPPYTNAQLDDLRMRLRRRAGFREEVIGRSVEGPRLEARILRTPRRVRQGGAVRRTPYGRALAPLRGTGVFCPGCGPID